MFLFKELEKWQDWVSHLYALFCIVIGWVIFALDDLGQIGRYFAAMFGMGDGFCNGTAVYQWYTHALLLLILVLASTQRPERGLARLWNQWMKPKWPALEKYGEQIAFMASSGYTLLLLLLSLAFLVNGSYNPFLYFRF